ncbi:MAG: YncE family protein, partial [Mesorhizobium sp.]
AEPDDTVSVIDVASGTVVETIRTGAGAHGVVVSADGAFVFVTNIMAGTVSQISVESQSVVKTYPVGKGPNGITFQAPKPTPANAG